MTKKNRIIELIAQCNKNLTEICCLMNSPIKTDLGGLCGDWINQSRRGENIRIYKIDESYLMTVYERKWWGKIKPVSYEIIVEKNGEIFIQNDHFDEYLNYDPITDSITLFYLGYFVRKDNMFHH